MFQCVPNLSEGRRPEVYEELAQSVRLPGVKLVDFSRDVDHNRMVLTLLGEAEPLEAAILNLYARAAETLDISTHQGGHPRIGAVDVVPFVPLRGSTMEEAVALARRTAARVADTFGVPVFLYEEAATRPERRRLPDVRHGKLEDPDFGPAQLHPQLGATVIGARRPLIAYNVVLDCSDLEVGRAVARRVRGRDGGLESLRAIAVYLESRHKVQVSLNLVDPGRTTLYQAFEMVRMEARRFGVNVLSSQVIGLCPLEALVEAARYYLQLDEFKTGQVLDLAQEAV